MTILTFLVTDQDTATALGSGDVAVLATPRLLAWMEAATVAAVAEHLTPGQTSVGVAVSMKHRRATAAGGRVLVRVTDTTVQDGRAECDVVAYEEAAAPEERADGADAAPGQAGAARSDGEPPAEAWIVGTARITRAVVDRAAFLDRLARG